MVGGEVEPHFLRFERLAAVQGQQAQEPVDLRLGEGEEGHGNPRG